jgi:hypothetical protein
MDMDRDLTSGHFGIERQPQPIALGEAGMRAPRAEEVF